MRAALLQIRQDPRSRAANTQSMMSAIDRAAKGTPAPDLLILPGACDTGGASTGRGFTEALLQTVSETIASKAREWGVYIAAGLHVRRADTITPCAVLFDPDGDRVVWVPGPMTAEPTRVPAGISVWPCAVGVLGVAEMSSVSLGLDEKPKPAELRGALIAWPFAVASTAKRRRQALAHLGKLRDDSSSRCRAYWGVVSGAGSAATRTEDGPATFLCAPDGRLLGSVDRAKEASVCVEVPIKPVPAAQLGLRVGVRRSCRLMRLRPLR